MLLGSRDMDVRPNVFRASESSLASLANSRGGESSCVILSWDFSILLIFLSVCPTVRLSLCLSLFLDCLICRLLIALVVSFNKVCFCF